MAQPSSGAAEAAAPDSVVPADGSDASGSFSVPDTTAALDPEAVARRMLAALAGEEGTARADRAASGRGASAGPASTSVAAAAAAAGKLRWRPEVSLPSDLSRAALQRGGRAAGVDGALASALVGARKASGAEGASRSGSASSLLPSLPSSTELSALPPARSSARARRAPAAADTAGARWFDLPAPELTPELKADLRVLRLRSAFTPTSFYKKDDQTKFPRYFQMGTVVEGAGEFYSARLSRRERASSFAEEIMRDPAVTRGRSTRYAKLQAERSRFSNRVGKAARRNQDKGIVKKKAKRAKH